MQVINSHKSIQQINKIQRKKTGDVDKKTPDVGGLVATTVLNIKITEVENKMSNMSGLVTTTALNTKISKVKNEIRIHDKYITTLEFNKLTVENYTARLK